MVVRYPMSVSIELSASYCPVSRHLVADRGPDMGNNAGVVRQLGADAIATRHGRHRGREEGAKRVGRISMRACKSRGGTYC